MAICRCCGKEKIIVVDSRGLCHACYTRLRRHGEVYLYPKVKRPRKIRYLAKHNGIKESLVSLSTDINVTLQSVAEQYGISRERVRQIYQEILGRSYSDAVRVKAAIRYENRKVKKFAKKYTVDSK